MYIYTYTYVYIGTGHCHLLFLRGLDHYTRNIMGALIKGVLGSKSKLIIRLLGGRLPSGNELAEA